VLKSQFSPPDIDQQLGSVELNPSEKGTPAVGHGVVKLSGPVKEDVLPFPQSP
jgi:hypothetical protein